MEFTHKFADLKILKPFTIEGIRRRKSNNGKIFIKEKIDTNLEFSNYYFEYPSGDLSITGVLSSPNDHSPHPVIILNHGYVPPSAYKPGEKTSAISNYLVNHGYITLSPDFRGWGGSDIGDNFFRSGLVMDVLNLIDILPSLKNADSTRIGIWGHSMGAGTALKSIVSDTRIKACVLYAPMSINDFDIFSKWGDVDVSMEKDKGNRLLIYKKALESLDFLNMTSPKQYLNQVSAAVQIHAGQKDIVAPPEWADELFKYLTAHQKEVEIFRYSSQGHYFSGEDLEVMLKKSRDFFDRHV